MALGNLRQPHRLFHLLFGNGRARLSDKQPVRCGPEGRTRFGGFLPARSGHLSEGYRGLQNFLGAVAVSPGFSGEILVEVVQRRLEDIGSSQATAITRGKAGASLSLR